MIFLQFLKFVKFEFLNYVARLFKKVLWEAATVSRNLAKLES